METPSFIEKLSFIEKNDINDANIIEKAFSDEIFIKQSNEFAKAVINDIDVIKLCLKIEEINSELEGTLDNSLEKIIDVQQKGIVKGIINNKINNKSINALAIHSILHDMNNKLSIITSTLDLYQYTKSLNSKCIGIINSAQEEIKNLKLGLFNLINNPDIKKITGKHIFIDSYEECDINSQIRLFCNLINPPKINVTVENKLNDKEDIFIPLKNSDYNRVVMNLIKNSAEAFNKCESIFKFRVEKISIKEKNQLADYLLLQAEDNGCGIDPDNFENIFKEKFSTKEKYAILTQERGYGLPGIKQLIEDAGGKITVESEKNVFTRFSILLPIVDISIKRENI